MTIDNLIADLNRRGLSEEAARIRKVFNTHVCATGRGPSGPHPKQGAK